MVRGYSYDQSVERIYRHKRQEAYCSLNSFCRPQPRFCAVEGVFARASHGLPGFISIAIGWEYKKKEEGGLRTGGEDGVIVRDMKPYATIILLFLFFFLLSMIRILSPHYIDYIIILTYGNFSHEIGRQKPYGRIKRSYIYDIFSLA